MTGLAEALPPHGWRAVLQANYELLRLRETARHVEANHPTPEGLYRLTLAETESVSAAQSTLAALANEIHRRTKTEMQTTPEADRMMK